MVIGKLLNIKQSGESDEDIVKFMSKMLKAKSNHTEGHCRRVAALSKLIGKKLGFEREELKKLEIKALLHDIGKIGIPDEILNKKEKLTEEEMECLKMHTIIGEDICKDLKKLDFCLDIIRHHHEKLNGTGYPDGIKADELSLDLRIVQVADIFDALYSNRPYRDKLALEEVREILNQENTDGCIDSNILNILYSILDENGEKSIYNYIE